MSSNPEPPKIPPRLPRSLDEARALDVEAEGVPREPDPAIDVDPCLICNDPGTGGTDVLHNVYCPRHWSDHQTRMAALRAASSGHRTPPAPPTPNRGEDPMVGIGKILERLTGRSSAGSTTHREERLPYRDDNDF